MQDREAIGTAGYVEARLHVQTDNHNFHQYSVATLRKMITYSIHHFKTVREVAWQALIDCGYMVEVKD